MSKKKNDSAPQITNIDELAVMTDEELVARASRFESERNRSYDSYPWEVEIAYIRREQQIRKTRAQAHADWLTSQPAGSLEEEVLTEDFDGSDV